MKLDIDNELDCGSWDDEVDVVVAGAGGAGFEAALEAAAAGAKTIVFEKQSRIWESSTAISVGRISLAGTDIQERQGVDDSGSLLYRDIIECGQHKSDPALVQCYVDHQLATYEQLCRLGIRWSGSVSAVAGMSVPRGHLTDPIDLVRTLRRAVEAGGVPVIYQTPVIGLIVDSAHRVVGVRVGERTGAITRMRARRGVVLATGGFARDVARLKTINPLFDQLLATSGVGHTGDGLRMAEMLGAQMRDLEHVKPSFELHASGATAEDIVLLFLAGGIIVNRLGERFVNESISYKETGMACLDQPGRVGFQIIDRKIYDGAVAERQRSGASSSLTLDAAKIRLLVKGDTLDELARKCEMPAAALARTIERYNGFVEQGEDRDFGRSTLAGNHGCPVKIDTPPFYACATISHLLATYGGLAIDAQMRVLRADGPISGLYAAGESVGGFHGVSYQSGTALGKALIFGRIAGRNAAIGA